MSDLDFAFAWEGGSAVVGPWKDLQVVSFRGKEAVSQLYHYEITLAAKAPAPEVDPHDLVHARATLRIRTLTQPGYKVVHGVVTQAEELYPFPGGMTYRVVLEPTLVRAAHRRRCRIFLEKTTRQIIETVLQDDPSLTLAQGATVDPDDGNMAEYAPAKERFTWRVTDTSRLDQIAARPYCVQYNESDLAFVQRLLEAEGIAYHVENGDGTSLLVLSDADGGRARLHPFQPLGVGVDGREITHVKLGARLRPRTVTFADYNWKKPQLSMVTTQGEKQGAELFDYEYPGGYPETPNQGAPLAKAALERFQTEADYAVLDGKARLLSAGSVFLLEHAKTRYEGEYLVTELESRGEQHGILPNDPGVGTENPFNVRLECARRGKNGQVAESGFRPARRTPRPRIVGSQTAFVTAEPSAPGAEINVGGPPDNEIGCVRLRFHWDKDEARLAKEPSSTWVRVSQVFAGGGQGGVWHPRVGVEVIVEFEEGDPDRPLVTGRVYNGANRPPPGPATYSTLKSFTSPGNGKYNEFAFEDAAGNEAITLHAARDWNSSVGRNRSENVGLSSSSTVAMDRTEATGNNRTASVGSNNTECVGQNEMITVGNNQTLSVGLNQTQTIGLNHTMIVGGNQAITVAGGQTTSVAGNASSTVEGSSDATVQGSQATSISGDHTITVGGQQSLVASGAQALHSSASQAVSAPTQTFAADGMQALNSSTQQTTTATHVVDASGSSTLTSPTVTVNSATLTLNGDGSVTIKGGSITIQGGTIGVKGGSVSVNGAPVTVNGGGLINMAAGLIKLN